MLAWFALAIASAVLAPALSAPSLDMVCTAGGAMPAGDSQHGTPLAGHGVHCVLCLHITAPPAPALAVSPATALQGSAVVASLAVDAPRPPFHAAPSSPAARPRHA